jgi:hypothetical protein
VLVLVVVPSGDGISGAGGPLLEAEGSLHLLAADKLAEGLAQLK